MTASDSYSRATAPLALWGTLDETRDDVRRYAGLGLTERFLEANLSCADWPIDRTPGVMVKLAPTSG